MNDIDDVLPVGEVHLGDAKQTGTMPTIFKPEDVSHIA
jgi:hypothetical protein